MRLIIFNFLMLVNLLAFSQIVPKPLVKKDEQIVKHSSFIVSYNEYCEQPNWVSYRLNRDDLKIDLSERKNVFKEDKLVKTKTLNNKDYVNSGFDKGHILPAGDRAYSQLFLDETFLFSNISPQYPKFNRGIWKQLEDRIRKDVLKYGDAYIITGPIITNDLTKVLKGKACLPKYFFKSVYYIKLKIWVCYIVSHNEFSPPKKTDFKKYIVSKDMLETKIGYSLNLY